MRSERSEVARSETKRWQIGLMRKVLFGGGKQAVFIQIVGQVVRGVLGSSGPRGCKTFVNPGENLEEVIM